MSLKVSEVDGLIDWVSFQILKILRANCNSPSLLAIWLAVLLDSWINWPRIGKACITTWLMTNHCSPRLTASLKSLSWCFKLSGLRCPFWHKEGCLDSSCLEQDLKSLKTWFKCEDARDPNFTDPGWIGASGHVSLAFLANFSLNAWTLTTSSGDSSAQMGFGSNGLNPTSKMSSQSWWTSELEQPYPSRFLSCTWTKSGSMCVNQASFCVLGVLPGPMEMVFSFFTLYHYTCLTSKNTYWSQNRLIQIIYKWTSSMVLKKL